MRVIALRTIKLFIEGRPERADSREPALAWYRQVLRANWSSPADLKRDFANATNQALMCSILTALRRAVISAGDFT